MPLDLPKRAYQRLSPPHWPAHVDRVYRAKLQTGAWKDPARSRILERVIARKLDCPPEWVLATSSCTAALGVAFILFADDFLYPSEHVGSDDQPEWTGGPRLRVCPLTYPATYCWAINLGWDIEYVDCDNEGWPVGPVDVGVELWGRSFPYASPVVLDSAHRVLSSEHRDRLDRVRAICYSFGPTKEIPCLEGGAIISTAFSEKGWREQAEALIQSGQGMPHLGGFKGYLSAPSAAAISRQISGHPTMYARRQNVLKEYEQWFGSSLLTQPGEASGHLAVVRLKTPGHALAVRRRLGKLAIDHSLHYPVDVEETQCPNAHALTQTLVSLPCNTEMRKHDVLLVARNVQTAV